MVETPPKLGTVERRWLGLVPARPPPPWFGVTLAVVLSTLGAAAHWLFPPSVAGQFPFITFLPAVLISAVWGGLAGGATATGLAVVLGALLFLPHRPGAPLGFYAAPMAVTLVSGLLVMLVAEILTRTVRALAASEERLRLLVKATSAFVIRLDRSGERLFPSPEWRDYTGQKHERRAGAWREVLHPDDAATFPKLNGEPVQAEVRVRHPASQGHRWTRISLAPVWRRGAVTEWLGAVEDIHHRKVMEEQGKILADELAHRARNGIGMVQAVVVQSAYRATDVEALRDTVVGRLQAMSRAQDILDLKTGETATLSAVLDQVLATFGRERFDVGGAGEVTLQRPAAIIVALSLYELGTNAMKYGALSAPDGRVSVDHQVRPDGLVGLTWRERGGPTVTPSDRRGFGHRLLQTGPATLGGTSELRMEPAGVIATLSFKP